MLKASTKPLLCRARLKFACSLVALCAFLQTGAPLLVAQEAVAVAQEAVAQETLSLVAPVPKADRVPLSVALKKRGDLSLQGASMEKALFTIGASWKVNIMIGTEVQGTVSCVYRNTPLREILDAILLANGYSYRAVGDTLVVQRSHEVGSANPLFESASIRIVHGDLSEVVAGAKLLLSQQGKIHALESARSILVVDYADRVATIRNFVAQMDASTSKATGGIPAESYNRLQVAYFKTQYIPVDNAKGPLNAVLSQVGRVSTMPEENRMVVVDYASNMEMVRRVLAKIDRPRPQIRITALIYDISLEDVEELGINLTAVGIRGDGVFGIDSFTTNRPGAQLGNTINGALIGAVGTTDNLSIAAIARLIQRANDARLLANPNITVMDNETATMSSVQQIPFQQLTQSGQGGGGQGAIATTAFKDVGVTLNVTPTVAADGTIKLVVEQEFSRVAGFTEVENQPIIDTRIANTTVRVDNRKTLVIGGMRQRSDTGNFNGIPYLKDVRWIGPLFRSRNTLVRESELIVFLQPEVVGYDQLAQSREYLAEETIDCRLARIPVAEGCERPGSGNCGIVTDESLLGDQLIRLPEVEGHRLGDSAEVTPPSSALQGQIPLRKGFKERYQGTGGIDARRQRLADSTPKQKSKTEKPRGIKRIFGL